MEDQSLGVSQIFAKSLRRQVNIIHTGHPMTKYRKTGAEDIMFLEHNARGVKQPHDDLLVIMLAIEGYNTCQVLVDNESSTNIMYMTVLGSKDLGFYVFRTLICIVGKPWSKQCV